MGTGAQDFWKGKIFYKVFFEQDLGIFILLLYTLPPKAIPVVPRKRPAVPYLHFFFNLILFIFLYSRFLLVIHFIRISVYMSIPISQFITHTHPPPLPPTLVSIRFFSTSVSQFLTCKPVHLYYFSRFHIHALIYDICFSLSDLLHSV